LKIFKETEIQKEVLGFGL